MVSHLQSVENFSKYLCGWSKLVSLFFFIIIEKMNPCKCAGKIMFV